MDLRPVDVRHGAASTVYVELFDELRTTPDAAGAVITGHKVGVYDAVGDRCRLSSDAQDLGELNVLALRDGEVAGYATDISSLGAEVDRIWPEAGGTVVCFGAGGSARALCLHLLRRDRRPQGVVVCESDERRALQLRELLAPEAARSTVGLEVLGGRSLWDDVLSDLGPASLVVNATGLGKVDRQCPLSGRACFPESATVWDLNYRGPLPYLWLARHQPDSGLDVVDGLSLFARGWLAALDALFGIGCPERFTRPFWKIAKGLNVP
jgi:shikimate 5-dehydrogenase